MADFSLCSPPSFSNMLGLPPFPLPYLPSYLPLEAKERANIKRSSRFVNKIDVDNGIAIYSSLFLTALCRFQVKRIIYKYIHTYIESQIVPIA